ncbi:quinone-dependent dihydroorotate dehydrogenase [Nonlabens marinus]|uniref:Dihydroorotate dehydrogenase (quinone) n=1 Tax=Nonlabens marinus S1-08 TaxID=1454201 RepID=W8VVN9_9FLAO|nr:quinone-dependent dihydroorotate dehydrogenase [Nonlabens marinus]BAO55618.1 dihydroorotate dehydrogenase [Nonlabens marinus S1-08]
MYKSIVRPLLFRFDPEGVHHFSFKAIKFLSKVPGFSSLSRKRYKLKHPALKRQLFGLEFENPVGLAAGFDKDAKAYSEFSDLGFGFVEIGTLTPKPQAGNPKTRLFRLKQDGAIVNRMGFNNGGVDAAVERLKRNKKRISSASMLDARNNSRPEALEGRRNKHTLIGGNIGKNKVTPNEKAVDDYIICFNKLFDHVDYFTVNVSSPNTPGLRELQDRKPLTHILQTLQDLNNAKAARKPILLKIAPDLTDNQLMDIIGIVEDTKIDGVIATNTTIERKELKSDITLQKEAGGLSGAPLTNRATEVISFLHQKSNGAFPIIGVGGIMTAQDAIDKLKAGASLVQLYTGFVYEGPALVRDINREIIKQGL